VPTGHVLLAMQGGTARLPGLSVATKADNFRQAGGDPVSGFRLVAVLVGPDANGGLAPVQGAAPAVSLKFVVGGRGRTALGPRLGRLPACANPNAALWLEGRTLSFSLARARARVPASRRAPLPHTGHPHSTRWLGCTYPRGPDAPPSLNAKVKTARAIAEYRKVEFPHATARITELRHIGAITAERLKSNARRHVGAAYPPDCPDSVTTVADMRALLQAAEHNA
jgi:hypothetical protein